MGAEGGGGVGDFTALIKLVIGMCCTQEVALFPNKYIKHVLLSQTSLTVSTH